MKRCIKPGWSLKVRQQGRRALNPFVLKKKVEQDLNIFFTALGNLNGEATRCL
jgi:hypothetical protein